MKTNLAAMDAAEIAQLDFSSLVAAVNEPNTPSGAHESIRVILSEIPTQRIRRVLDVGCNTGFATLELAGWLDAEVVGLDLNDISLSRARDRAGALGMSNVQFVLGSLLDMPFDEDSFDLVYCNNVTSFISDRGKAMAEYLRVLRPQGVLAVVPIYYRTPPPPHIIDAVSAAIRSSVEPRGIEQWLECFSAPGLELIFRKDYVYDHITDERITEYAARVTSPERTPWLDPTQRDAARVRLQGMYKLFNENLSYCGFSVLLFRLHGPNPVDVLHTSRAADT